MPRLYEKELYTVVAISHGQVVPQAMTTEAEELEQLVALGASDGGRDMALRGLRYNI